MRADGAALVFERAGAEEARSTLSIVDGGEELAPDSVDVSTYLPTEHGARLSVTVRAGDAECTHEVTVNGQSQAVASVRATGGGAHRYRVRHSARVDDWRIWWRESTEGVRRGKRSVTAGSRGRGVVHPDATEEARPRKVRATDEAGGELTVEWDAATASAGIEPDVYGPAAATDYYECDSSGSEAYNASDGFLYIDEGWTLQDQAGFMWWAVTCSGTVSNATLTLDRLNPDYSTTGSNTTVPMRAEASNNPATRATSNPWGRTYRSTQVAIDWTDPGQVSVAEYNVTTLIQDLLTAGYTYAGSSSQGIHLSVRDFANNIGIIEYIAICSVDTGSQPKLTITYTPGGASEVSFSGSSNCASAVSSGAASVAIASVGTSVAASSTSGGSVDVVATASCSSTAGTVTAGGTCSSLVSAVGSSVASAASSDAVVAVEIETAGSSVCEDATSAATASIEVAVVGSSVCADASTAAAAAVEVEATGSSVCADAASYGEVDVVSSEVSLSGASVCGAVVSGGQAAALVSLLCAAACGAATSSGSVSAVVELAGASLCETGISSGTAAALVSSDGASVCGEAQSEGSVVASIGLSGASAAADTGSGGSAAVIAAMLGASVSAPVSSGGDCAVLLDASGVSVCSDAISFGLVLGDDSLLLVGSSACAPANSSGTVSVEAAASGSSACSAGTATGSAAVTVGMAAGSVAAPAASTGALSVLVEASAASVVVPALSGGTIVGPFGVDVSGASVCDVAASSGFVSVSIAGVASSNAASVVSYGEAAVRLALSGATACEPCVSYGYMRGPGLQVAPSGDKLLRVTVCETILRATVGETILRVDE